MDVRFKCHHCGVSIETEEEFSGTTAPCPGCEAELEIPEPGLQPGAIVGTFQVESMLGAGAMGQVFKATQMSMDRPVALKVLIPELVKNEAFINRFHQEVRLLARMDHPNIVRAYEAGQDGDYHFLAITFVNGRSLDSVIKEDGCLDEARTLEVLLNMARALDYAWKNGQILHRDIKPANIMISAEGEILLMDLGISKSASQKSNMTQVGQVIGTPWYMSPEQAMGKPADFRSDLYALGCILYQLLSGQLPFDAEQPMAVLLKQLREPAPPLPEVLCDGEAPSDSLRHLYMSLMAKKPSPFPPMI